MTVTTQESSLILIQDSLTYTSFLEKIFNHRNINYFSFFNNSSIFFMINIYSDEYQTALKCPKNIKANLHNILVMAKDFNISNYDWDPSYLFHSSHSNSPFEIADSFDLKSSILI